MESALALLRQPKNPIFYQFFPQPTNYQLSNGLFSVDQGSHYSIEEFRSPIQTQRLRLWSDIRFGNAPDGYKRIFKLKQYLFLLSKFLETKFINKRIKNILFERMEPKTCVGNA